jgi:hypothetical protein
MGDKLAVGDAGTLMFQGRLLKAACWLHGDLVQSYV